MTTNTTVAIEYQHVSKRFKGANYDAVSDVNISINEGEFITILGSSGSGKTTLLKMTNRLYDPDTGKILLFGENINDVDAVLVRRRIGYAIQQVGLLPHMTIAGNIAIVPKLLKWDKNRIETRVHELITLVGLDPDEFLTRYPAQLSGGQQQRVGLARALAVDPKIMLLDEPFGAIDAINRLNLQDELKAIHKSFEDGLRKTFLFVTHDINEALKLGTRVIVMNEGQVCQFDTPENIVKNPADGFVESLIRSCREQEKLWEGLA
ncbi:MAG: ABC transporter ATP-binding protein [Defluviitaleaceae bacterium]|nr:ABC transporter ATP-binding protein [Defluviitaleaceae bacterium]